MAETTIEWTDKVWNPTTGCTRVSSGCKNCYAFQLHDMRHAAHRAGKKLPPQYAKPFTELQMFEDRLGDPLGWRKSCRVFVNSMSDLFHKDVSDEFIDRVFAVMALASRHTFQVLTKRPERMASYMASRAKSAQHWKDAARSLGWALEFEGHSLVPFPLPNVWLGTSVEDQATADARIPHLLNVPARVRFLSMEPLLGPVDFTDGPAESDSTMGEWSELDLGIHWVIVGGESGPKARPFGIAWARSIVSQCKAAGVPVFVKQLGSNPAGDEFPADERDPVTGRTTLHVRQVLTIRDKKGGDWEEWPSDLRVRDFPNPGVPA